MDEQAQDMVDAGAATASADNALNQHNNQSNDNNMDNKTTNHNNQNNNATNNQNNHADVLESGEKEAANGRNGETASSQHRRVANKKKMQNLPEQEVRLQIRHRQCHRNRGKRMVVTRRWMRLGITEPEMMP